MNATFMKILMWGFLLWAGIFAISFVLYPLKQSNSPLFETLMAISLTAGAVVLAVLLFKNLDSGYLNTGIQVGFIWFFENILIDLPLFSYGPMRMTLSDYLQDIGLTYFIIPIITIGFGWLLEAKSKKTIDEHVHLKDSDNREIS